MTRKIELTGLQICTIIATLDGIRSDYFEKATDADRKGHENRAKNHYETAERYETIILALQAQMKEQN
jgi:hypothetical protein